MSDLISRIELLKRFIVNKDVHRIPERDCDNLEVTVSIKDVKIIIKEQPTAYDIDKIVEKLEKIRVKETCNKEKCDTKEICRICVVDDAIEIVKQEAEKFVPDTNVGNNGWIPCSEKLPELRQDVLVTVKYTGFMGMHGYWIQTGHMEAENDWWGNCAGGEVIAWQPLPEPYQPKGE